MQASAKRVSCSADTKSKRITIISNSLKAYSERGTERCVKDLMGLNFLEVMQSLKKLGLVFLAGVWNMYLHILHA